ncbi:MAG TPA: GDSL-type esterase/lipase family protein [Kiritimatiellia bacterium]|nr:GDSL-type esterase/lipase family protein [Kiritimatiellia bacterium]HRZ12344.1 GDSL-type esterase/lipase family protein [Kiritimatiellia bacterium]HSA17898.1 GDSL-type esterase/lipase family protein [Kiritimatiellia bacterium]
MKKRILPALLTLLIALVAAGAIGEFAVRRLGLAPPLPEQFKNYASTPAMPYGPKPHSRASGRSFKGEFEYDYRHNAFGLRDGEHELSKPPGVFRILGLGDSFTYGVGAAFEETYLHRLEQMLNTRPGDHPRVEIIKAGIPRYFPEPERILLEKLGLQFQPDLVIVGFVPNDVIDTFYGLDAVTVDPSGYLLTRQAASPGAVGRFLYKRSHLCRLVLARFMAWRNDRVENWAAVYEAGGAHEADWRRIEDEFARMAALAGSIGARLVIAHVPRKGPWTDAHDYPARRLAAWAEANGAGFVDTRPAMRAAPSAPPLYYPKDGHCTPTGYAMVAGAIARGLEEGGWVP